MTEEVDETDRKNLSNIKITNKVCWEHTESNKIDANNNYNTVNIIKHL